MTSRTRADYARPAGCAAAAFVALLAGYLELARGSTELAPVLLVTGYCVLIPLAILAWPRHGARAAASAGAHRPSYLGAALAALAALALYLLTLAPSTAMWDTSEYIAATKVLGLPHPPGNPLFILLGHVFGLLPIPASYAVRINVMAALASALAAGFWFLIVERVLAAWLPRRWQWATGGAVAVLVGATSFTVWNQSVVNEKVYTVSLAGIALVSWLMVRWSDDPSAPGAERLLVLVAYLLGLGYANHPAGFLPLPAAGIAILARRPAVLLRPRVVATASAMLALGLTTFSFEPIRAAHFPPINEGEPTACATHFAWSCTFDRLTYHRLVDNIERKQYGKPPVMDRQAPFTAQVGMWWLYFKWQWLRDAYGRHPVLQSVLAVLFFALGAAGAYEHWRRHRPSFWYFAPLVATLTVALIFYLNFKYGWSQAPELGNTVEREVRDRDYFYVWSFSALSVWVAIGLAAVWQRVSRLFGARAAPADGNRPWLLAAPVFALALVPLIGNAPQAPRSGQVITRDWAADILSSVEPYAILVTNGDNDTFPLWYAQEVEGIRPDVTVVVGSYLRIDWFARQLIRRPIRDYDPARGPAIYRDRVWKKPSGPPLAMTLAQADSIPDVVELREPQIFRQGELVARIPAGVLYRDDIVVLRFIKDAFPERPIYFASVPYGQTLGLAPYLLTQGLVHKLLPGPIAPSRDTLQLPNGYFDLRRTEALWRTVYRGPRELIREGGWVDRASVATPYNYAIVGSLLSEGLALNGDTARARSVAATVQGIAYAARLPEFQGEAERRPAVSDADR
jgi:hypothetical protein